MTEKDVLLFIILLMVTIIPICLYICIDITRDINATNKRCDEIEKWAKRELDNKNNEGDENKT